MSIKLVSKREENSYLTESSIRKSDEIKDKIGSVVSDNLLSSMPLPPSTDLNCNSYTQEEENDFPPPSAPPAFCYSQEEKENYSFPPSASPNQDALLKEIQELKEKQKYLESCLNQQRSQDLEDPELEEIIEKNGYELRTQEDLENIFMQFVECDEIKKIKAIMLCKNFFKVSVECLSNAFLKSVKQDGVIQLIMNCRRMCEISGKYLGKALIKAAKFHRVDVIQLIINCGYLNKILRSNLINDAIEAAGSNGINIIQIIEDCGYLSEVSPEVLYYALKIFARHGNIDALQYMINRFPDIPAKYLGEALKIAASSARSDRVDIMQLIINCGRGDEISAEDLGEALKIFARYGNIDALQYMINHFPDIPAEDLGEVLKIAVRSDRVDIMQLIINCGRGDEISAEDLGEALKIPAHDILGLHKQHLSAAALECIIKCNRFPDIPAKYLGKALKIAAKFDRVDIMQLIINCGLAHKISKSGIKIAYREAKSSNNVECAKILKPLKGNSCVIM